jgi:biopolymer transport protein ExbD
MGHAGADDNQSAEPNLVSLLDIVLQLVMFFMICANFVMEQVNETIKLPESISAKSIDRKDTALLFLNVDEKGHVLRLDGPPLTNPLEIEGYLKRRHREDLELAKKDTKGGDEAEPKTLVIIRAHQGATFEKVYRVMSACRKAGYRRVQLRAIIHSVGGG